MNLHKSIRSLLNHWTEIKFGWVRLKLKILYNDVLALGQNVKLHKIKLELHPEIKSIIIDDDVEIREDAILRLGKNATVRIGSGFFANKGLSVNALNQISIGKNTIFGENVKLYDHNHGFKDPNQLIKFQSYTIGKIEIGQNCWIGSNVVILKDVSIGDNCIIGANCLIYKNVKEGSIIKASN